MTPDPIAFSVAGPADAPVVLFINPIGATRELWDPQLPSLARGYRVICYDTRGHGRSPAPPGEYTIAQLGQDALAILDAEGAKTAHVCGLSLGGLTAMWLGVHAPERVASLVLANTAARIGTVDSWTERIRLVREHGMQEVANLAIPRWFTPGFAERNPQTVARFRAMVEQCPIEGYVGCCAALRDADLREAIAGISCPVLAVAGSADTATPVADLQFIHEKIAGSKLVTLDAAHLSNVEQPAAFTEAVDQFLAKR